jgi:hypothetical protein
MEDKTLEELSHGRWADDGGRDHAEEAEVREADAVAPTVTRDPESGLVILTPQRSREYPIRDVKLLAQAKAATQAFFEANTEVASSAMTLLSILRPDMFKDVQAKEQEKNRILHRIVASTAGKVKADQVHSFDLDRAVILLKPAE